MSEPFRAESSGLTSSSAALLAKGPRPASRHTCSPQARKVLLPGCPGEGALAPTGPEGAAFEAVWSMDSLGMSNLFVLERVVLAFQTWR